MAGNYPDYGAHRIPYESDGTKVYASGGSLVIPTLVSQSVMNQSNDESVSLGFLYGYTYFLFPRLMDIYGVYCIQNDGTANHSAATSVDSTNGLDGTWVARNTIVTGTSMPVGWRTQIDYETWTGVRWARIFVAAAHTYDGAAQLHLFGQPSTGENADRLEIWHPTLDQRIGAADLDWGNAPQGSTADKTFRVKNLSSVYTASTITVSLDAPTDSSPSFSGQNTISNGGAFAATQVITSLAPGAISGVHTLRRITPSNAVLGVWAARLKAVAASWA